MKVEVTTSSVVDANIQEVWAKIRDFNGLPSWFPSVIKSKIEKGESASKIGCIRCYEREDGLVLRGKIVGAR